MKYKNVFKQFWEKGIKFMSSSTKNVLWQNKIFFFFIVSSVVSIGLEDYFLQYRDKWFCDFSFTDIDLK